MAVQGSWLSAAFAAIFTAGQLLCCLTPHLWTTVSYSVMEWFIFDDLFGINQIYVQKFYNEVIIVKFSGLSSTV